MDWNALAQQLLPTITRMAIIVFSTLGVVYMTGRLLFPKMKDRGKNITAFVALVIIGYATTLVWDFEGMIDTFATYPIQAIFNYGITSFVYTTIGSVFYVVLGWRFYSRVDAFLDNKFAKDDKRRQ